MATPQQTGAVIIARQGKTYPSLVAWIDEIKDVDLPLLLPAVALSELNSQKQIGKNPSNILVDGRASSERGILEAKRRVQLFFLDVDLLVQAVEFAYAELLQLYKRRTGAAARTIQVWGRTYSGGFRHERLASIASVREYLNKNARPQTFIRLLGPDVPFRRQLYYTPPGGGSSFKSVKKVSALRLKELEKQGAKARVVRGKGRTARHRRVVQVQATRSVSDMVESKVKAQFGKSVYITTRWIKVPSVVPWKTQSKHEQGVPAVAIGWRLKGAL